MEKIIELKKVNKHYGGVHALKDVDFSLNQGEIHCLIGQNGCGKSTMIKVISGVIGVDPGSEVILDGKKSTGGLARQAMAAGVRVIYQDLSIFPNLTVAENIAFDQHVDSAVKGVNWSRMYKKAQEVLDRMKIQLDLDVLVEELSIADRQLVAIARALATNAKLLIMDEPIEIAERITVMRDGCIISTFENTDVKEEKLAQLISGQQITYQQKFTEHEEETVLEVERLSRARQYEDVSFSVKKGEIVGIIGLLGAGRTELASSIFGMNPPDSGRILLHGKEVKFKSNRDAIASRIAYVPEDRLLQGLVLNQSVENNTEK